MRAYMLSMARFFKNYHTALSLLDDREYAILVFLAMSHQAEKHDDVYIEYSTCN